MPEINLLPQKKIGFFSEEKLLLFTKTTAIVLIILVASLSILFFLLSRDPSVTQIKADEVRTRAQLTLLQDKTAKYLIIVDRLNKLKALEKTRTNFDTTIQTIVAQIPSSVTITNFALDKDSVTLALSASDLSLLGKSLDNFTHLTQSKKILKSLSIQGLVSDEKGGSYVLTLSGNLL